MAMAYASQSSNVESKNLVQDAERMFSVQFSYDP